MVCDEREIEYWQEKTRVRNDDIESWKNITCLQIYRADV